MHTYRFCLRHLCLIYVPHIYGFVWATGPYINPFRISAINQLNFVLFFSSHNGACYTRLLWPLKVLIMITFDRLTVCLSVIVYTHECVCMCVCVRVCSFIWFRSSLKLHAITKSKCENRHKDLIADHSGCIYKTPVIAHIKLTTKCHLSAPLWMGEGGEGGVDSY